jgi:transposase-like protein
MDALDACDYSIHKAATRLGIQANTLYHWIRKSENLSKYIAYRLQFDAVKAREKLEGILEQVDHLNPAMLGHVIQVCKILLDKAEADKTDVQQQQIEFTLNTDAQEKIKKLLDGE